MNPSRNDPAQVVGRVAETGTPSELRYYASAAKAEPTRIAWLRIVWTNRCFLRRATLCGVVLSFAAAFLLPVSFESETRLMPPEQQVGMGGSGLAILAALAGKGDGVESNSESASGGAASESLGRMATEFLGSRTSGALVIDILGGATVQDSLVQKFDLRKRYHDRYWLDARNDLGKHTKVKEDRKSGVISITVSDRDPYRAQEMAKSYIEALNTLLAQVSTSSARRERIFLEQRLTTAKANLDAAALEYSNYASKTGALDVPSQTKAMVESESVLEGQLAAAESELQGLEQIYTGNNIRVRTLRARIAALRQQVDKFSGNEGDTNSPQSQIPGDLPSLRKLPLVGVRWANLYREYKIQQAVYQMLTQEYELAKIREEKEIPTVRVLDSAVLPERKSFPPRTLIIVLGGFLSLLFAAGFVIAAAMWKESKSPEKQLAAEIWEQITAENARSRAILQQVWSRHGDSGAGNDDVVNFPN